MLKRGLAFCLVLSAASVARAGATIDLKPLAGQHNDAGNTVCYELGTAFDLVDVWLQQSPAGQDRELRHVQLDFAASTLCPGTTACSNALFLVPQATHGTDRIWYFGGEPTCVNDADATCGDGHFFETSFTQPLGREKVVSMTWYFVNPADLNGDAAYQRTMFASNPRKIAQVRVELPTVAGNYTLDARNAAQTNPDLGGADIRFGFGSDVTGGDGVALTTWRANLAAPNNIGGSPLTITMAAVGGCGVPVTGACCRANGTCQTDVLQSACSATGETWQGPGTTTCSNCTPGACCVSGTTCEQTLTQAGCQARPGPGVWQGAGTTTCTTGGCVGLVTLVSSAPTEAQSLWRSERNIMYFTFNAALPGLPPAGSFKVEKITGGVTPNCTFQDITAGFTLTLTNAVPPAAPGTNNSVLQVRETAISGGPTEHRAWYRISSTAAWTGVAPFSREFVVQVGDADANRFVTAIDVGQVNASPGGAAAINSRFDIDGNGFRTAIDVGQANASQGGLPAKPCDPPPIP